jgi:O-antigen/teichoic acid export membrane protein
MRDHALVLGAQLSYSALRFVTFIVLARLLTKDEMGQAMFGLNYVLIFIFLGTLGLDSTYVHFAAQAKSAAARLQRLVQNAIGIALVWGAFLGILGMMVTSLGLQLLTLSEIALFMLSVPFALIHMYGLGILLGLGDLISYSILFIAQPALFLLAVLLCAGVGELNIIGIALALCTSYILTSVIVLWRATRRVPRIFSRWQIHWEELREQVAFSIFVYINLIGLFLDSRLPILVMGWLNQVEQVAYYSLAMPITEASLQVARSVGLVLLARASAGHLPARAQILRVTLFYIPAMMLLIILAPWAIPWFLGNEYTPAVLLIQVLALGMIPLAAGIMHVNLLTGMGRPRIGAFASVVSFAAMVALSSFLIPFYGAVGAVIAAGAAYVVYWSSAVVLGGRPSRYLW